MYEFLRSLNSFVSNDVDVDLDIVENLFGMIKGNMLDANWPLSTLGGYNHPLNPFHV